MKRIGSCCLTISLVCWVFAIAGCGGAGAEKPPEVSGLAALVWLSGHWRASEGGVESEEFWLAPNGGLMLGLHRDVLPSGAAFFEYLRIEESAEGIFYIASPSGGPASRFELVEVTPRRAAFRNDAHDWPQKIIYRLDSDGALHGRAEGMQDGRLRGEEWIWRPVGR